ncbi:NAD(P)-binding protein [Fomitopsis serialis]|uniref:NAD(P)-binding protein n=1 Tax=Fomitopsis serialis TaxID=139415 RepID=UPI002007FFE9|nr:NAD(P)-binding protein [Neoantrodia serialis]KAH9929833.1 NAD(P)-binding protein [Neoantrodia serialis]
MPDLTGQVMIVTGGNAGLGKETVRVLLEHNAKVYIGARDEKKARAAIEELREQTGNEAFFLELNLANLASVRKSAEEFLSKEKELHVLFNNAGVTCMPLDWVTDDGYDMTFGTNVVGESVFDCLWRTAFNLRCRAFPLHKAPAPHYPGKQSTTHDKHPRVIWLSSLAAYISPLCWDTFKDGPARRKAGTHSTYQQSKLANVILARQCAKRFGHQSLVSLSVNPGTVQTDIMKHATDKDKKVSSLLYNFWPVETGVLTSLWAGTMPEPIKHNGEFVVPWGRISDPCRPEAYDDKIGNRLWDWLELEVEPFTK